MEKKLRKTIKKIQNEKGQILIISFIFMMTILSIMAAFIFMTSARSKGFAYQAASVKSFWLAEAGLEEALYQLYDPGYDNYRDNPTLITCDDLGSGSYEVGCVKNADHRYTITSIGWIDDRNINRTIKIVIDVKYGFTSPGFTARNSILVSGQGEIDGYDSSLGVYGGENISGGINMGCNGTINLSGVGVINGDIESGGNVNISGQAGIYGDVSSGGLISGQDLVSGSIDENVDPPPQPFDDNIIKQVDAEVEKATTDNDNNLLNPLYLTGTQFSLGNGEVYAIPAGKYYFTEFSVSGTLLINEGDSVTIYYDGSDSDNLVLAGDGIINASDNATNLSIISRSACNISVEAGANFSAIIIAPRATATYTGQADFFGGIIAEDLLLSGGGKVHMDLSPEISSTSFYPTGVNVISWAEE